jgi:hypothetical protein
MPRERKRVIRQRAKQIRKANKPKLSTKDYIQRTIVILIIVGILATALILTQQ